MKSTFYKKGIDVSAQQGRIDFSRVKASGVDFVIIRCGYGSDSDLQDDPYFERNAEECEKHGIPWGAHLYSYAADLVQAENEYKHIMRLLEGKKPEYPIYIDMEDADGYKEKHDISDQICVDICEKICDCLEKAGYYAGIYSNLYWLTHKLNSSKLDRFDKCLVQWSATPTYYKPFGMWQNSNSGDIAGIVGQVGTNIAYQDYPAVIKAAGLNGWNKEDAPSEKSAKLKVGDTVRVKEDAFSYEGKSVATFVYQKEYVIDQLECDRALLDRKGINTPFHIKDLVPVKEEQPVTPFRVGDVVTIKNGAADCDGQAIPSIAYKGKYVIDQLNGDRAVLDEKGINTAVHTDDLILTTDKAGTDFTWYTVKIGDSFWRIAEKMMGSGLKCLKLAKYNGWKTSSPLHPGMLLKIPKA